MIRETKFVMSRRPYAVDLSSLRTKQHDRNDGGHYYHCWVEAVWFRRRPGVTVACTGILWDYQDREPVDATEFLELHTDGRYGGQCDGRWDGGRYWGAQEPDTIDAHLALLRPMLDNFPEIPDGYDGWWRFG